MRYELLLAVGLLACGASSEKPQAASVTTFRGLLDSLAAVGGCPRENLPHIAPPMEWETIPLSDTDKCALVAAALRRLGGDTAVEPIFAPTDTSKVVEATAFVRITTPVDSTGSVIGAPDTVGRVELDITGRPRLVWVEYQISAPREVIGAVHRGPDPPH